MRGCTAHTKCLVTKRLLQTASLVFCRGPQRQKSHCCKLKGGEGGGGSVKKTHPSGRGKDNFPRLEGGPQIFPKVSPHAAFSSPTAPHHDPGTYTRLGRGFRDAGQRGFPKYPERTARTEIPAWRKRGRAPAQGRRGDALPRSTVREGGNPPSLRPG